MKSINKTDSLNKKQLFHLTKPINKTESLDINQSFDLIQYKMKKFSQKYKSIQTQNLNKISKPNI